MENILLVRDERDKAVNLLETGQTGEPEMIWKKNEIGLAALRHPGEHYVPQEINSAFIARNRLHGKWINRYLRQLREKRLRKMRGLEYRDRKEKEELQKLFPDAEFDWNEFIWGSLVL